MLTLKNKLAIASGSLAALLPQAVLAQDYDYTYSTSNELTTSQATGLAVGFLIFFAVIAIIGLVSLIFWILMLVHATKNDIPDKNMWIVILIVGLVVGLGLIAAIVYYFAVKKKFDAGNKPAQPQQTNTQ